MVYEAYDSQLERKVAIKLLNPQSDEGTERAARGLLEEARAVASLTHPNIVAVYDAGQSLPGYGEEQDDMVYVVMELIDGQTAGAWRESQKRPWRDVVRLYAQAGEGLIAAHARGLIHRDFKPGNIMIDRMGRVVVLDFGLARSSLPEYSDSVELRTDADVTFSMRSTRTVGLVGTPAYMAPEQLTGDELDPRCDQFSFCVSLYETLVGQRPFGDDRVRMNEVIHYGAQAHPAPSLRELDTVAPPWLRRVLRRGLEIDRSRRYPDMASLVGALRQGLVQRRRRIVGAVLAVGLTTASAATYVATRAAVDPCPSADVLAAELWTDESRAEVRDAFLASTREDGDRLWSNLSRSIDDYTDNLAEARVQACRTAQVGDTQATRTAACLDAASIQLQTSIELLGSDDADVMSRAADMISELPLIGECSTDKTTGFTTDPTDIEFERLLAKAAVLMTAGRYEDVRQYAQQAHALALDKDDRSAEARAQITLGWVEILHDDQGIEPAEQRFHEALVAAEAANNPRSELLALIGFIHAIGSVGARHAEADRYVEQAMAKLNGHSVGPLVESQLRRTIGLLRYREYRYKEATEEYERSEQLLLRLPAQRPLDIANCAIGLGDISIQTNDYPRATQHFERAKRLVLEHGGPYHRRMAAVYNGLGTVALAAGQNEEARDYFVQLRTINERRHGPEHPGVAVALINEARALVVMGHGEDAVPLYDRAIQIRRRYHGERHPSVARSLVNRAGTLQRLERLDEALADLQVAENILESAGLTQQVPLVVLLGNMVQVQRTQGRLNGAVESAQKAWDLLETLPEPPAQVMVLIEAELAYSLHLRDGGRAGVDHIEHAYAQLPTLSGPEEQRTALLTYLIKMTATERPSRARTLAADIAERWCDDEDHDFCTYARGVLETIEDPE